VRRPGWMRTGGWGIGEADDLVGPEDYEYRG
jgi:hypothetical protein